MTADFCPVCQAYKRGALADEQVAHWAGANAETVYLEWERDADAIEALGVEKWPATLVLDASGTVLATDYGKMEPVELIGFANAALPGEIDGADASPPEGAPADAPAPEGAGA